LGRVGGEVACIVFRDGRAEREICGLFLKKLAQDERRTVILGIELNGAYHDMVGADTQMFGLVQSTLSRGSGVGNA
jgi:hypothetical protein